MSGTWIKIVNNVHDCDRPRDLDGHSPGSVWKCDVCRAKWVVEYDDSFRRVLARRGRARRAPRAT